MSFRLSLTHSVQEQHIHIVEPVATEVLQFILEKLGYLEYFREHGYIAVTSDFSGTSKSVDDNGNPILPHDCCTAKVNLNMNPQSVKWQGNGTTIDLGNGNHLVTNNPGNVAERQAFAKSRYSEGVASIMSDTEAFTDLIEYTTGTSFTMEVLMDFKHTAPAFECFTRIFQCFQNGEMIGYVDVQYDYPVPPAIQAVYQHISELMGYDDYALAMINHSRENLTIKINRNNPGQRELVVNKNHFQALYQIECTQDAPAPGDRDGALITLNVTVQFARANRLMLKYPVIVNNQFVNFDFIPLDPVIRENNGLPSPVMWRNLAVTRLWERAYHNRVRVVHYPWWDDWDLPPSSLQVSLGLKPIAIIAFCLDHIDDPDGETVIDLIHGLPGIKLNDDVVNEILTAPSRHLLFPYRYVNVAVFAEDVQLGVPTQIEDNVKPVIELNAGKLYIRARRPFTQYRLVISINEHPLNLTHRPLSYEVYPSRWYDLLAPVYVNTKDSIVNTGKTYFYYDTVRSQYVELPTTEGEPIPDVLSRLSKVEELYVKANDQYVPTTDLLIKDGVSYYVYDPGTNDYVAAAYPVGKAAADIRARLAEAGCVYELREAQYGPDIIVDEEAYIGYTQSKDEVIMYDTTYYSRDDEGEFHEETELKPGDPMPDPPLYTKDDDERKFYINKVETDPGLAEQMQEIAVGMTSDNVIPHVYEEVEIPAGTPVDEVKETLGVTRIYTDNPNPPPTEPVYNATNRSRHYQDSYRHMAINTSRVWLTTFYMGKRRPRREHKELRL